MPTAGAQSRCRLDNHRSFTGRFFGITVESERRLQAVGVQLINAAPAHPQTLGKLERFHRTLKDWLRDEGPAADLEELQGLLDRFRVCCNERRPHQRIGNHTPAERYRPERGRPEYPADSVISTAICGEASGATGAVETGGE